MRLPDARRCRFGGAKRARSTTVEYACWMQSRRKEGWWAGVLTPVGTVVAIVTSCISLLVSCQERLSPFAPVVTAGQFQFHFGTVITPPGAAPAASPPASVAPAGGHLAGIVLSVAFAHGGGKAGTISDIVVRVSRARHADGWIFIPRFFVDERAYITHFEPAAHTKWIQGVFAPFHLARGTAVSRALFFQGNSHGAFPDGKLQSGEYEVELMVRKDESPYEVAVRDYATFTAADVTNLRGVIVVPDSRRLEVARGSLTPIR